LLAGAIAAAGAVATAMVLSEKVLGVAYEPSWPLPLASIFIGGACIAIAGLIGTRRAVSAPPLQTLRSVG
jgi:putative ABC transport system permease protein